MLLIAGQTKQEAGRMDNKKDIQAVESYLNGSVGDFKKYLKGLSKIRLLECLVLFIEYRRSLEEFKRLLENA